MKRRKDPQNRKPIAVALTAKGDEALQSALVVHRVIDTIMSCLSQDEQDNLWAYLERLRESAIAKGAAYPTLPNPIAYKLRIPGQVASPR